MQPNHAAPAPTLDHVEPRLRKQGLAAHLGLFALVQDELQPMLDEHRPAILGEDERRWEASERQVQNGERWIER